MNPHLSPLVDLLADRDGEVRASAAGALTRLTGRDQGRKPDAWRDPWSDCQPTHERWKAWLAEQPAGAWSADR